MAGELYRSAAEGARVVKATIQDRVFGTLTWDEDSETYSGVTEFRSGRSVPVAVVVNTHDSLTLRENNAFLATARNQFLRLRADDAAFRSHASELFQKAFRKAGRAAPEPGALVEAVALAAVEIHNTGVTQLRYGAGDLWPRKHVTFYIDGSDNIVM